MANIKWLGSFLPALPTAAGITTSCPAPVSSRTSSGAAESSSRYIFIVDDACSLLGREWSVVLPRIVLIVRVIHAVGFHEPVFPVMVGDHHIPVVLAPVDGVAHR